MAKETHEFQAETKQLLDLMIHSIYTNHEIFLRELISNASDAIDKVHFASLTNRDILEGDDSYEIFLEPDKENHTLTICDNGIGMSRQEVIENIGTIAKSGTKAFMEQLKKAKEASEGSEGNTDKELIGQFGVGFYSAFMVAEKVVIETRKAGETEGTRWESQVTVLTALKNAAVTSAVRASRLRWARNSSVMTPKMTSRKTTRWNVWSRSTATMCVTPSR